MKQKLPNICISGVPGTGKSTLAQLLAAEISGLKVLNLSKEAKKRDCRLEFDEELQTWEVDEELLAKRLSRKISRGGFILDWIHADLWSADLIDLVITLRADNDFLYQRYEARKYSQLKINDNLDAEIMDVIGEENREKFGDAETTELIELESQTDDQMAANLHSIAQWVAHWRKNNS